jgi:hypothetical protein
MSLDGTISTYHAVFDVDVPFSTKLVQPDLRFTIQAVGLDVAAAVAVTEKSS